MFLVIFYTHLNKYQTSRMRFLILQDLTVCRTITHSAVGGLISSRDFTDLVINVTTDDAISTNGEG